MAAVLGGAVFAGCPVFAPGDAYNAPVTHAAIDANSDRYITSAILAGDTDGFWIASPAVEYVNVAAAQTPRRKVRPKAAYHRFESAYPWEPSFRIEPLNDAHAIVVDPQTCRLFETYDTSFDGTTLSAYSGTVWNLRAPFQPLPPGTPSSMASGLSLFAGAVRWEEIARGRIDHALNWAPPAGSVAQWSFVAPASDTDGVAFRGESSYALPYGAHLRLKASFDASHFGPQAKATVRAMKTYGIYLADTGSDGNALYNTAPPGGSNPWDKRDLAALGSIRLRDFDVLRLPPLQRVPGH